MDTPGIGLSLLAGILSFLSPCVLPLLPSYLSYVGGVTIGQMKSSARPGHRSGLFLNTLLFTLGFSVVFVALGVLFSGSALLLPNATTILNLVAGIIVVLFGINIVFDLVGALNIEKRLHFRKRPRGRVGSFLVGVAFAAGWTPCIGPILTSILFLAGTSGRAITGVVYLTVYSAGLSLPFLLSALFFNRATTLLNRAKRYFPAIRIVSGLLLVAIGVLIATGRFQNLNITLYRSAAAINNWAESNPLESRFVPGSILAVFSILLIAMPILRRLKRHEEPDPISGDESRESGRSLPWVAGILSLAGALIATLQFTGAIDVLNAVSGWLQFQGL